MPAKKKTARQTPAKRSKAAAGSGRRVAKERRASEMTASEEPVALRSASVQELPVYEMREARVRETGEADAEVYDTARTQWLMGDWDALADLDVPQIGEHPKRAKLALLVASARHEVEDYDGAGHFLQQALSWGASRRDALGVLIGQTHAALGRAALLARQYGRAEDHFRACITSILPTKASKHYAKGRLLKEVIALGDLPEAQRLLGDELGTLEGRATVDPAQLTVFKTRMELLSHELSLALQRRQVGLAAGAKSAAPAASQDERETRLEDLRKLSTSQLGQDLWVLEKMGFKRGGYFVEFGATDGVRLNNTYLLEKEFGWTGLCAEPNPEFLQKLQRNRSCTVSAACIAGESGQQVEFILADEFGGIAAHCQDMHDEKRRAYRDLGQTMVVSTVSLDEFLRKHNAPRTIDYLSIDTEGSEYEILKNFPFDEWEVRLITVEHNFTPIRASIRELLTAKGYVCREAQWDDWYELTPPGNRG
jgi:FkbM family methyltransferase